MIAEIQWKIEWSEKFKLNTYSFKSFWIFLLWISSFVRDAKRNGNFIQLTHLTFVLFSLQFLKFPSIKYVLQHKYISENSFGKLITKLTSSNIVIMSTTMLWAHGNHDFFLIIMEIGWQVFVIHHFFCFIIIRAGSRERDFCQFRRFVFNWLCSSLLQFQWFLILKYSAVWCVKKS